MLATAMADVAALAGKTLEIKDRGGWFRVDPTVFRSWAGQRRVDGAVYHGRVFVYLSDEYCSRTQARACGCPTCNG